MTVHKSVDVCACREHNIYMNSIRRAPPVKKSATLNITFISKISFTSYRNSAGSSSTYIGSPEDFMKKPRTLNEKLKNGTASKQYTSTGEFSLNVRDMRKSAK
jgi:hypothetical protein